MNQLQINPSSFNDSIRSYHLRLNKKKQNTKNSDKETKDQVQLFSNLYIGFGERWIYWRFLLVWNPRASTFALKNSKLRQGVWSPFLLEEINRRIWIISNVEDLVINGEVLTNQLKPENGQTSILMFSMLMWNGKDFILVPNVVYDRYFDKFLIAIAREKRGISTRSKVTETSMTTSIWKGFAGKAKLKCLEFFRFSYFD